MIGELIPLHGSIPIHINLLEELNQRQRNPHMFVLIRMIKVEMFEHHPQELLNGQALILLLEALLNDIHLLAVEHLHDVCLGHLVLLFLLHRICSYKNTNQILKI